MELKNATASDQRSILRRAYDKFLPNSCKNQLHAAARDNQAICNSTLCVLRTPATVKLIIKNGVRIA